MEPSPKHTRQSGSIEMESTSEELFALRAQLKQLLEDHTLNFSKHIDALFAAALEQRAPGPKETRAPSSLQAAGLADSLKSPNHANANGTNSSEACASGNLPDNRPRTGSIDMSEGDIERFVDQHDWWHKVSIHIPPEPDRSGWLADVVNSKKFDAVTVFVIFLHTVFAIVETNWQMKHSTLTTTALMFNIELAFTCAYIVELFLRFAVHRCYFFWNNDMKWNVLDLSLVVAGLTDALASSVKAASTIGNPTFLRFFRVLRVGKKLLRVVRLLQFFPELRLMIRCVLGSAQALFWSFMLLFGFAVVFAILIVQQFTVYLADSSTTEDSSFVSGVHDNFGSVWAALLSLFMATSGGKDWGDLYDYVKKTGVLNSAFFLIYIAFVWLSITNIIISVFCDKAIKLAQPDVDESLLLKRKGDLQKVRDLKSFFTSLDLNESGTLSVEELEICMSDVRTSTYFDMMGLDIKDAEAFFSMLTSMSGKQEVDVHTFVTGWLKMKGAATSLDVYTVQFQTQLLEEKILSQIAGCRQDMMQLRQQVFRPRAAHSLGQGDHHNVVRSEYGEEAVMSLNQSTWQLEAPQSSHVDATLATDLVREVCSAHP